MATEKRLRMSITGSGLNVPYITSMYYDLNFVDYDSAERQWFEHGRDMLNGRAKKPFHDLIPGYKMFSTKIVKWANGHVANPDTPYHVRRCTIVGASKCWVEIGLFHIYDDLYEHKDLTAIKIRNTQMTFNGTWSTSDWRGFNRFWEIDWDDTMTTFGDNEQRVQNYMGHTQVEGSTLQYYFDMALMIHRYPHYENVGWFNVTQSSPYNTDDWKNENGVSYPTRYWSAYGGGCQDIVNGQLVSETARIQTIQAVIVYILTGGQLPEFPYTDDGEGGGDGNPDNSSDDISIPTMPVAPWNSINNSGMVTLYNVGISQMTSLSNFIYSENALQTALKKVFQVPIDAILDFYYLPISIGSDYTTTPIVLGGYNTGISARRPSQQYRDFDFGSIFLENYFDSFLDYEPYTSLYISLPFIGIKKLDASLYTNASTHLVYRIDLLSGCFVAYLEVTKSDEFGTRTMLVNTFSGNCAIHLPLTNASATGITNGILSVGAGAVGAGVSLATGNPLGLVPAVGQVAKGVGQAYIGNQSLESVTSYSGNLGFMGCLTPYFIIERPIPQIPFNYSQFNGFTSETETTLALLSGYTQVHHINLPNIGMSDEEQKELLNILQSGIVI